MKPIWFAVVAALAMSACNAVATSTVTLSRDEQKMARSIAEHRYQVSLDRQALQNEYQGKMNRLNEQESDLNIQSGKLILECKKNHTLPMNGQYVLDEWNGQLVKQ